MLESLDMVRPLGPVAPRPWTAALSGHQANAPEPLTMTDVAIRCVLILGRKADPQSRAPHVTAAGPPPCVSPSRLRQLWRTPVHRINSVVDFSGPMRLPLPEPTRLVIMPLQMCLLLVMYLSSMHLPAKPRDRPTWTCPRLQRALSDRALLVVSAPRTMRVP